jgi:chromosome segregation ATPase
MSLEEQMRAEMRKLEAEIDTLDQELAKLHGRILQILAVRRKKEHDLRVLRQNLEPEASEEIQTSLAKILKER